jgi:hypothetical protein
MAAAKRPAAGSSIAPQHSTPQRGGAPGPPDGGAARTSEAAAIDAENRAALAALTPEQVRLGGCHSHG